MKWLCLAGVLAVFASLAACSGSLLLAQANLLETGVDVKRTQDIAYGEATRQQLDVYVAPQPGSAPRPVVVFFHGGSWTSGNKDRYRFVGNALAGLQTVAIVPSYRLYPAVRFPVYVEDAARAVAWAQAHAAEYGGDPDRVFVMGHSAGAQLAALVAFDGHYLRDAGGHLPLRGFIGLSGPYDFLPLTSESLKQSLGPPEQYPKTQPVNFVTAAAPPAFLAQGRQDRVVLPRNSESLSRHYAAVNVPLTLQMIDGKHGATLKPFGRPFRDKDPLVAAIAAFIQANP